MPAWVRLIAVALLAGGGGLLTGCVIHPSGTCGPSCDDIEVAAQIDLSSHRLAALRSIAARKYLSDHEQIYLVNAILHGGVGGEHANALITLINNPVCEAETRKYIAQRLRFVTYSSERRRISEALVRADSANPGPAGAEPRDRNDDAEWSESPPSDGARARP